MAEEIFPIIGGDGEGNMLLPDILVDVHGAGGGFLIGVVKVVFLDGSLNVAFGPAGNGDTVTVLPAEVEMVVPERSDKVKIMSGALRGATGKLIGIDGNDGIVRLDDTRVVKILDMGSPAGNGDTVTVLPAEVEMVVPERSDKIKIMSGAHRGATGKLIEIHGNVGTRVVKILDMGILAKLAPLQE